MNISRIFNQLFSNDKKIETNQFQKKNRESDESQINVKQISLNNIDASQNIEVTFKQIQTQVLKEKNPHKLETNRVMGVLNGEKTARLDAFRTEVLKNVIADENKSAVVSKDALQQLKNFMTQKVTG